MILNCPLPESLTAIPQAACPFKFDQIVRLGFQRRQPSATPPFATLAAMQTLATWTGFRDAVDDTKIVLSPIISGLVIPKSEGLFTGGNDNTTFNGIADYNGEGAITVTGTLKNIPPVIKRAMDLLVQESLSSAIGISNLTLYMFNRSGYGFAFNITNGEVATTTFKGFPTYNFRISSAGSEGFNAPNVNDISFQLPADWADYLISFKPNFDPLTDLDL